ncbi:MAG: FUSC family protein [Paraclostridium sp.]
MKLQKIGMRNIKTGIAVMICVMMGNLFLDNTFFAVIACVISMQNTVKASLKTGMNRISGTIVGGIIGFLFALISPGNPILCGLGIMTTIYICNLLGLRLGTNVAYVTFASIQLGVGNSNPIEYSIYRVIDTSVGVLIGIIVNYFVARPDYTKDILNEFREIEENTISLIEEKLISNVTIDITLFYKKISKLDSIHKRLVDELEYSKESINLEELEKTILICKEIYFHLQSIEFLEKRCYLTKDNYNELKKIYGHLDLNWDLDESESPVFNYHLSMIIKEINILKKTDCIK